MRAIGLSAISSPTSPPSYLNTANLTTCAWQQLPANQDVGVKKGYFYAIVASVSKNYSKQTIQAKAGSAVKWIDYVEQGQRSGIPVDPDTDHRTIAAVIQALTDASNIPWHSPSVLGIPTTVYWVDSAWAAPPTGAVCKPAPKPVSSTSLTPVLVIGALGAAAGLGWYLYKKKIKR